MRPAHARYIGALTVVLTAACSPPKPTADSGSTTESESSAESSSSESSESSSSGESIDMALPEPPECTSPPEFGFVSFEFGSEPSGPGAWSQICTVVGVEGTVGASDGASAQLECPGLEPTAQLLYIYVSADQNLEGLPLSPGESVEVRGWFGSQTRVYDVRDADTLEPRVTFVSTSRDELVLSEFLDGGGPEPDFLAPYAIEPVDLGCETFCDPGGGTFTPACQQCDTRMGLSVAIDDLPAQSLSHGSIVSIPEDEPQARAYARSMFRTSEDCEFVNSEFALLLLGVP